MLLKADVDLRGMQPQILVALIAAERIYQDIGRNLMVTSVTDGKHMDGSLHYKGLAADFRTTADGLAPETVRLITGKLKAALGPQFDVVVEVDHLHVEFDPKDGKVKA
jgi:hypothetical protein